MNTKRHEPVALDYSELKNDSIFNRPKISIAPEKALPGIDIELSNHCNALCYYCPRDLVATTGFMEEGTFKTIIDQIHEHPEELSVFSCGHGESVLHPRVGEFVRYARSKGLSYGLQTNGSPLNASKRAELLDAGLTVIHFSVSAIGDLYEKIYQLEFNLVLNNIKDFIKEARGACKVGIYIVQTDLNKTLIKDYKTFWEDIGVNHVDVFPAVNRSGSIAHKNLIYTDQSYQQEASHFFTEHNFSNLCHSAVMSNFIGWDGNHYLCSNDWEKQISIGHVSDITLNDALTKKAEIMLKNESSICARCDWNIKNRIIDSFRQECSDDYLDYLLADRNHEEDIMKKMLSGAIARKLYQTKAAL